MRSILLILIPLLVMSCGEHDFPRFEKNREEELDAGDRYQYFTVNLMPLNHRSSPLVSSQTLLWYKDHQFYAKIVFRGRVSRLIVRPMLHAGARCPDVSFDYNGDGLIDAAEAMVASGEILLPLDRNLQSRERGNDWFPVADRDGDFVYSRSSNLDDMLSDLGIHRLEDFALTERTLILYGARGNPMLPIACGKVTRDNR